MYEWIAGQVDVYSMYEWIAGQVSGCIEYV